MKRLLILLILLPVFAEGQTIPPYVPLPGLLAWYPFTGNAIDSSGGGHDGTVVGATLTTDRFGNANSAYFYNGASKITTQLLPPTGNSARTISSWFKYDSLPFPCGDHGQCIVGYGGNNRACSESDKNFSLELTYTPVWVRIDGICIATAESALVDTVNNTWHFFAAEYDPSFGDFRNIKLYVDGAFKPTSTSVFGGITTVITDTLSRMDIGAGHYNCPRYFNGKIDDIGVWNRALTPCELLGLYTAGASTAIISPGATGTIQVCIGMPVTLSDAITGGSWSSSNTTIATVGSSSGVVTGVSEGTAIISYTTVCGSTNATVVVSSMPDAITGAVSVCAGSTTALSDAVSGGKWSSSNTVVATVDSITGLVTGLSGGTLVITYATLCGIATTTVTVTPSPGAGTITGVAPLCVGTSITLSDSVSGGVWSISNTNALLSGVTVTGVSPGSDTISYTVTTPSCGTAITTAVVTITLSPDAGAITGDTSACAGTTISLSDPATGGVWGSSNSTVATVSAGVVYASSAGTATIGYAVTNACGTATTTYPIKVFAVPPITPIIGQDSACPDAVFMLSDATPGGHWTNTNPTVLLVNDSGRVTAFVAGNAVVIYTIGPNAGGCTSSVNFPITVSFQGNFVVNSTVTPVSCYGEHDGSIHLSIGGSQTYQYLWNSGINGPVITDLAPGNDTVSIKAEVTQCLEVLVYHITQPDPLLITATAKDDTCDQGKGTASATATGGTPPYVYHWSDNKTGQEITGLLSGTYSVTVTDSNGCTKSTFTTVHEGTCNNIIIHDVLTPNGDGKNDTWEIEGIQNYPENSVQVFDKWGNMVYEKINYNNSWNGGKAPDGTYFYLIKLNTTNRKGGQNVWTGSLLIKR